MLELRTRDILQAEIVFGQPNPAAIIQSERLRWLQLSSAGYARYDTEEIRTALRKRSAIMTNSSSVFDEPCAEHLMAWLLADARQLYPSYDNQRGPRGWPQNDLRRECPFARRRDFFHRRLRRDRTTISRASGAVSRSGRSAIDALRKRTPVFALSDRQTLPTPSLKRIT